MHRLQKLSGKKTPSDTKYLGTNMAITTFSGGRPYNEDAVLAAEENTEGKVYQMISTADGAGGSAKGEDASEITIDVHADCTQLIKRDDVPAAIKEIYDETIRTLMMEDCEGKTTVATIIRTPNGLYTAHVGDARNAILNLETGEWDHISVDQNVAALINCEFFWNMNGGEPKISQLMQGIKFNGQIPFTEDYDVIERYLIDLKNRGKLTQTKVSEIFSLTSRNSKYVANSLTQNGYSVNRPYRKDARITVREGLSKDYGLPSDFKIPEIVHGYHSNSVPVVGMTTSDGPTSVCSMFEIKEELMRTSNMPGNFARIFNMVRERQTDGEIINVKLGESLAGEPFVLRIKVDGDNAGIGFLYSDAIAA